MDGPIRMSWKLGDGPLMVEENKTYHFDLLVFLYGFLTFLLQSILLMLGFSLADLSKDLDITIMLYKVPCRVFDVPPT